MKRFLSMLITVMVLLTCTNSIAMAASSASDLEKQLSTLEKQLSSVKKEISKTQGDITKQKQYQTQLDQQISITEQQLTLLSESITQLDADIVQKEQEITYKQTEIDENYELLKNRLRSMYMNKNSSLLEVLLTSKGIGEFITKFEAIKIISKHDKDLIEELKKAKEDIEKAKETVVANKAQVEANKKAQQEKTYQLNTAYKSSSEMVSQLKAMEQEYLKNKQKIDLEMQQVEAEIQKVYSNAKLLDTYVGESFGWPVPNYSWISSYYGPRWGTMHTGIDIAGGGIENKPIVASVSGRVIQVVTNYTPGVGYGRYMIIDHGGGYSTLYGHCNTIYVKIGDWVAKGQTIAAVGNTGHSTGPHLHFEIRKKTGGVVYALNPMDWLYKTP